MSNILCTVDKNRKVHRRISSSSWGRPCLVLNSLSEGFPWLHPDSSICMHHKHLTGLILLYSNYCQGKIFPPIFCVKYAIHMWFFCANYCHKLSLEFNFFSIVTQKRKVGTIAPKKFIARLKKEKIEFDNNMQQVSYQII